MSDVKASPPPAVAAAASSTAALPGSERPDYRGKCLYKTGKCMNERALKTSGAAHNLCDEHRNRQNQHQRKLDAKNRLHKRERRASGGGAAKTPKNERFSPYPGASTAQRHALVSSVDTSDDDHAATVTPPEAAAVVAATTSTTMHAGGGATATTQTQVLATASSGVMFLLNGPQTPQVSYPFVMQDFDGIVVPLPSYLEGQERIEFRSRIYQKVLDFISEECILRFGARVGGSSSVDASAAATTAATVAPSAATHASIQAEPQASEEDAVVASLGASPEDDGALGKSEDVVDESRTTGGIASKKVH